MRREGRGDEGWKSGFVCVEARGRYKRELLGSQHRTLLKRRKKKLKKKIKRRKKEISGLTTYRHTFPPSTTGHQKVAHFFYTPTSTRITPRSNLGILPPRSHPVLAILGISVSQLRLLRTPCPARPALARSLGKAEKWGFPLSQPHKSLRHGHPVSDDLLSGRYLSRVLVSQVPTKSDTFVLETSLMFLAPGATSAVQF
jgi:hypothetical protein